MKQLKRVAIIHDWLTVYGGAEKVLKELLELFPEADLFSVIDFFPEDLRHHLLNKRAKTTFIQRLPFAKSHYPFYLPLMPLAIEQLDLSGYDLILSSSHAVAKGVIPTPSQCHICYCHTPMRYVWDLQHQYLKGKNVLAKWLFHKMRLWDVASSHRVDAFVANSHFVASRIEKAYRRKAVVIPPPCDLAFFTHDPKKTDYYLVVSRLVAYKKIDLIVEAFSKMPERKLIVIGSGPEYKKLQRLAKKNVTILGQISDHEVRAWMQRAKAFVFAGIEDFGKVGVEAQACGTPVIAFGQGGMKEIVRGLDEKEPTGCFFYEQTIQALIQAIEAFEKVKISTHACRANAERFSKENFQQEIIKIIREQGNESTHLSWGKWNEAVAPVKELLSQTISENRRKRIASPADCKEDAARATTR